MSMTLEEKVARIRIARRAVELANQKVEETVKELFKRGDAVQWKKGHHVQTGTVEHVGYLGQMTVFNHRTGNRLHLDCFHVTQAFPADRVTS